MSDRAPDPPAPLSRRAGSGAVEELLVTDVTAPPFDYNPSSMRQRGLIAGLAFVASAVSLYMGLYQWGFIASVWDPLFGTGTAAVLSSRESEAMHRLLGIPDAVLGAWAYLTEVVLSLAGSTRRWQFRPWLVLIFGLDVIPLGLVSAALVVLQGVSVGSWCFLCLVTAAISLVLVALAYDEVWASLKYLGAVWSETRDRRLLWQALRGDPSDRIYRIALAQARRGR